MIGQTSQTTGLYNILNSLGLDGLEENDDQIEYRAFANDDFGRTGSLRSNYLLETFSRFPCLMRRCPA
jgi:hypothetical protein